MYILPEVIYAICRHLEEDDNYVNKYIKVDAISFSDCLLYKVSFHVIRYVGLSDFVINVSSAANK